MPKTHWHPAFCAAMRLELKDNPSLQFINEFNLTEKPLEVDMLIINKPADVKIENPVGEFFREHNLLEYKSPSDHKYNAFAFGRALSYAYYYCDRYQTWDVTLSMVVTEELDETAFKWLSALTDKLTGERATHFLGEAKSLTENEEKRLAKAIAYVLLDANRPVLDEIKEGIKMTWREYLQPEFDEYADEKRMEDVRALLQNGIAEETIKVVYKLSDDQIMRVRGEMK